MRAGAGGGADGVLTAGVPSGCSKLQAVVGVTPEDGTCVKSVTDMTKLPAFPAAAK